MAKTKTKTRRKSSGQLEIKVKKLLDRAVIPKYMKEGDAGLDLVATSFVNNHGYIEYGTGLSFEIPKGYVGLVYPRSSISERGMALCNGVGVIDSGYRGELKCRFRVIGPTSRRYEEGERIAQLVIMPYPAVKLVEADELAESERGGTGFGSTNK